MLKKSFTIKSIFLLLVIIGGLNFGGQDLQAQQDAMFTEYMFNSLAYNPAYAGSRDAFSGVAIYRHQWNNFDGAPRTINMNFHGPVRDKYGLGLNLQFDKWGVHQWSSVQGSYSYKFYVAPRAKVAIGVDASLVYQQSDYTLANPTNIPDPTFARDERRVLPNFGFGIYFYSNWYYIGLSAPQLINNQLSALSDEARQFRHYYLAGGLVLPVSNNIKLKPSVLVKSVGAAAPTQADFSLNVFIYDAVWAGLTYRTNSSVDFLLGFQLNRSLRVGYAFDLIYTDIQDHTDLGSHEIMLGYDFNLGNQKVITPRYF